MTVRPVTGSLALDRADANLAAAIKVYGVPPCWSDPDAWSDAARLAVDVVSPRRGCHACPVFAECEDRAPFVAKADKAHSVIACVRYDAHGEPVDETAELARQERDRRLLEALERRSVA
ncbi:MAG TPA: hypothetical protein VGL05_30200 [Kribbella sp.]